GFNETALFAIKKAILNIAATIALQRLLYHIPDGANATRAILFIANDRKLYAVRYIPRINAHGRFPVGADRLVNDSRQTTILRCNVRINAPFATRLQQGGRT